ncbi:hypothetical protein PINS_up000992 [Pythium insidiosum]|nr:hypothetical protein PINS_up000992 [Pythium insidiosum]
MLQVALPPLSATPRRLHNKKTLDDDGGAFPLVLETHVAEPVKLVDDGVSAARDASVVSADADVVAEENATVDEEADTRPLQWETEDEDEDDSDYREDEDAEDGTSDEEDDDDDEDAYRRSLEMELDEDADEDSDVYLKRMLEARDRMEGEDAAWVERYIQAQREWKEKHGTSIDEIDLDLRLARSKQASDGQDHERESGELLADVWLGRVSRCLPPTLRQQPIELLVSTAAVALFVVIALGIQFYVAFRAPRY